MAKQLDLVDFIGKRRNALVILARKRGYVIEKPKKGLGSFIRKKATIRGDNWDDK